MVPPLQNLPFIGAIVIQRKVMFVALAGLAIGAVGPAQSQSGASSKRYLVEFAPGKAASGKAALRLFLLKMEKTVDRNAVLVYLAMKDRQFAVFADEGIYKALGKDYWTQEAEGLLQAFTSEKYGPGLVKVINDVGEALHFHFPYEKEVDKNELPDDIVFGK